MKGIKLLNHKYLHFSPPFLRQEVFIILGREMGGKEIWTS